MLLPSVLMHISEPDTFQMNRFYTASFFSAVKKRLIENGVFGFSLEGFDNYLTEAQKEKLSVLHSTLSETFKNVLFIPGRSIYILCSDGPLETDIPQLLSKKGILTAYIDGYYEGDVTKQRIDYLNSQIKPHKKKNSDANPYLMQLAFNQWFFKHNTSPLYFYLFLIVLTGIYLYRITHHEFLLFTTGAVCMGSEMLIIFSFQIYFGYVYQQIGLIVTLFLAGLIPGAVLAQKQQRLSTEKGLIISDCVLIGLLFFYLLIVSDTVISVDKTGQYTGLVFPFIGFVFALVCGFQFPVVLRDKDTTKTAVNAFSADLMGAGFGVILTATVFVPLTGLAGTALILSGIKGLSLFRQIVTKRKS